MCPSTRVRHLFGTPFNWKAPQLLEYAAKLQLDTIQFSSMGDYESFDPAYLQKVKDQANRLHIQVDGGTGCICPSSRAFAKNGPPARDRVLEGLRVAKAVGAKIDALLPGRQCRPRWGARHRSAHGNTIKVFRSVRSEALDLGVKIAIEKPRWRHAGARSEDLDRRIRQGFRGLHLDTGNPLWVVEDPLVTLEVLAPYAVTTHIRDSGAVRASARGGRTMGWRWAMARSTLSASSSCSENGARNRPCNWK